MDNTVNREASRRGASRANLEKILLHHVGLSSGPLRFDLTGVLSLLLIGDEDFGRVDKKFNELDTPLVRGIVHVGDSENTPMVNDGEARRSRVYLIGCSLLVRESNSRLGNDSNVLNCMVERRRSVSAVNAS